MLLFSIALVLGLVLLVWSSDLFIENAAIVAEKLNVSPIIIGVTLVALGTSAPEMVVSAVAAIDQAADIAIGNVVGSNIANIALVFGATLLFGAIPVNGGLIRKEIPILISITLLTGYCFFDGTLDWIDGTILVTAFAIALVLLLRGAKDFEAELTEELPPQDNAPLWQTLAKSLLGLIVLIGSSKLLVWGATGIASALGVSELVIGLTIVAIGTSLPELAASITSVRKGHHDIAIGNVIGSNIFNLATVLPMPAFIAPGVLQASVVSRDYGWMLGLTVFIALVCVLFVRSNKQQIPRIIALPLLGSYAIYLFILAS
ncbi:calcium/sodium antiporter [Maribrevibacterium harenarium]|uniref:Calcium/sodium antiporter n=1 Tax=Maribrevibacterium harenarium TaxID=2589817 RepID=A0A501WW54_9GAMM|nr:calcium/sodium antiporter [Maribrevibacterium harenarium]TPE52354.1 calcium/sodium antiporter [Maribrevibacterium harenarium]